MTRYDFFQVLCYRSIGDAHAAVDFVSSALLPLSSLAFSPPSAPVAAAEGADASAGTLWAGGIASLTKPGKTRSIPPTLLSHSSFCSFERVSGPPLIASIEGGMSSPLECMTSTTFLRLSPASFCRQRPAQLYDALGPWPRAHTHQHLPLASHEPLQLLQHPDENAFYLRVRP